jgi:EAL and modified HD-GYP domain-containing signal transduction protein
LLDRAMETIGYELLFRADVGAAVADFDDGDTATARVLVGTFGAIGFEQLIGDKTAFVNITSHYILQPDLLGVLPSSRVVLEIVESTEVTDEIIHGIRDLTEAGFRIALDDYDVDVPSAGLLDFAHMVKYELGQVKGADLAERIAIDHRAGRTVVVERIETAEDFAEATDAGADYFQGYFFARPAVVTAATIPPNLLALVRLLDAINSPSATIDDIVEVLVQDVSMSVMVLRFVNSAASGLRNEISSISQAAILIGRDRLRSWCALALMSSVDGKPIELVTLALTRAKFCKIVAATRTPDQVDACYTAGMLSLLDAMTDISMDVLVEELAVDADIRAALLGEPGPMTEVLELAVAFERSEGIPSDDEDLVAAYQRSMSWATAVVKRSH